MDPRYLGLIGKVNWLVDIVVKFQGRVGSLEQNRTTIPDVPTYANDAAAISGGLVTGQLYKTTSGGSTVLKIVP